MNKVKYSFNRTYLELKHTISGWYTQMEASFNRTYLELKHRNYYPSWTAPSTFNRTYLELKRREQTAANWPIIPSIVPTWN